VKGKCTILLESFESLKNDKHDEKLMSIALNINVDLMLLIWNQLNHIT
jgi:hypothetical protein